MGEIPHDLLLVSLVVSSWFTLFIELRFLRSLKRLTPRVIEDLLALRRSLKDIRVATEGISTEMLEKYNDVLGRVLESEEDDMVVEVAKEQLAKIRAEVKNRRAK